MFAFSVVVGIGIICRNATSDCFFDSIIFDEKFLRFSSADQTLFLRDLLRHVDSDVTEASELARESSAIDEVTCSDERELFRSRRQNVVFAFDDANSALGT